MKKRIGFFIVLLGLGVVILGGCNPCKRLALKCPSYDSTTIVIETVHDTIWVKTPADSLQLVIPMDMLIDLEDLGLIVESVDQKVSVKVIHDTLFVEAKCKDDSLQAIVDSQRITIENTKTIYIDVPGPDVKHNGKFAVFAIYFFILVVILIGVWIYTKVKSGAVKRVLNQLPKPFGK